MLSRSILNPSSQALKIRHCCSDGHLLLQFRKEVEKGKRRESRKGRRNTPRKMRSYMEALEEERRKIQVFERELPLCLELVIQAIERCKQQLSVQGQSSECNSEQTSMDGPVLEEFIPLKGSYSGDDDEDDVCEDDDGDGDVHHSSVGDKSGDDSTMKKSDWLRSVQLWNPNPDPIPRKEVQDPPPPPQPNEVAVVVCDVKSHQDGAFHPFQSGENDGRDSTKKKQPSGRAALPAPDAAACSTAEKAGGRIGRREERSQGQGQAARRKQRRCWSPELHRLFLQSLQQLGGPHVATPKQIREVMKIDGLTNDEVKSHLQKYRLHTRRPSPNGHGNANAQAPHFVVVGGLWMQPPDFSPVAAAKPPLEVASNGIYAPVAMLPQPLSPSHKKCGFIASEERSSHRESGVDHFHNSSSTTSTSTHTTADF
ncbi:transcription factor HHO3-like [Rhodamnia argentea]|uniref:Transcription factor HHO3-like n=1 Tax=Rhodamnia argentea TaxID=178133 RepID=A0A8B8QYF8_9MYRT|nr:transcription factor HHO3-like [Rhodamnia argentea]XP_048137400.1 transcription factor HHO3-like [Rhodamnia argentea]